MKDSMEEGLQTQKEKGKICMISYSTGRRNDTSFNRVSYRDYFLLIQLTVTWPVESMRRVNMSKNHQKVFPNNLDGPEVVWEETGCVEQHT